MAGNRRVVVTGCGLVSSLGSDVPAAFARLRRFENTVRVSEELAAIRGLQSHLCAPADGWVQPERYTRKVVRTMSRVSVLALDATEQALSQAGLLDSPELRGGRTGVAYGSSSGGVDAHADFYDFVLSRNTRGITSSSYIRMMGHTTSVNLSVHFGTTGRLIPTSTACTSGSLAIGMAYETIASGAQDIMIAGGAEEFSALQVAVFDTLFATSRRNDEPSRTPRAFDARRDGLVVGEGSGTVVLESLDHALARGATPLAEICGFGTNTDGRHVTQPNAETQAEAMRLALRSAGLAPADIGYVNAHGTATQIGDATEAAATAAVFGDRAVPVSTIKNYTGHTLGACGAIEAILAIEMLRNRWLAPNINVEEPDPQCAGLDLVLGEGRETDAEYAMSNNFAFGGINTSLVLRRL